MFRGSRRERMLESLQTHLDFFAAAAQRHELWINDVSDPEIEKVHLEILGLLKQTRTKYQILIDSYNGHSK